MFRIALYVILLTVGLVPQAMGQPNTEIGDRSPAGMVDCFIGTSNSRWMLGPYAQRPFGMVQLGPDNQGNVWMGGYEYAINSISGFSHLHAWTMGGLRMMPATADLVWEDRSVDSPYKGANAGYHSRILKDSERAEPGYYAVTLYDHDVDVEITTTTRCGFQRYTFPANDQSRILIDLQFPTEWDYGFKTEDATITKVNDRELEGYVVCRSGPWSSWNDYTLYFVVRLDTPFDSINGWVNGSEQRDITTISGRGDMGVYLNFKTTQGQTIQVQTGLSLVDAAGARRNLDTEMTSIGWDFDRARHEALSEWNALLGKIQIEGGTPTEQTKFYTNLYRSYCGKQTWSDIDGRYRDAVEVIRNVPQGAAMYGGDAFWNSYWNLNGLWSIITPRIVDNWTTTQLEMFRHTGATGKGPAGIEYSGVMEGSHELALIIAAYHKGIRPKSDGPEIYDAVYTMVTRQGGNPDFGGEQGQIGLDHYVRYGYMPTEHGVVSKTLDYAYDDWCVAQLASTLGHKRQARELEQRSQNFKNVFDPATRYVTRRDSNGVWDPEFDPFSNRGFIEGNSWQYSWYVPHNTAWLVDFLGVDLFNTRLEDGFEKSRKHRFSAHAFDRTAGQSAEFYINHGNEVNMCTPFLFNYSGRPWLCQKYSREILDTYYGATPYHGWEGDEDEGQMGAWYVMSALGLFEMDGGVAANSMLEITSPLFERATIALDSNYYSGKTFTIEAIGNSDINRYIQSMSLNGKPLHATKIAFADVVRGGTLTLVMGPKPNYNLVKTK